MESSETWRTKALKSFAISKSGMQGGEAERNPPWSNFLMTVISATFGALHEVHFLHSIYHFKAQEVKNPTLQTMHDSELKWRSYIHCKQITLSWMKNFARLWNHPFVTKWFRSHFAQCCGIPPEVSRYFLTRWKPNTTSWKTTSQRCEISRLLRSDFAALLCVCEISQTLFSPAKWSLVLPDICNRHLEIFFFRFLL